MCQHGLRPHVLNGQKRASFSFLRTNVQINVPTCQRRINFWTWLAKMPTYQKACQFFNFACQKVYQFFNYFPKEFFNFWIFQFCLTFANFKNIWAILENFSRETKNLNNDIWKISKVIWKVILMQILKSSDILAFTWK